MRVKSITGTTDKEYIFHFTKHDNTVSYTNLYWKKKTRNKINHEHFVLNSWRSGNKNSKKKRKGTTKVFSISSYKNIFSFQCFKILLRLLAKETTNCVHTCVYAFSRSHTDTKSKSSKAQPNYFKQLIEFFS